jgi:hypothetical protein
VQVEHGTPACAVSIDARVEHSGADFRGFGRHPVAAVHNGLLHWCWDGHAYPLGGRALAWFRAPLDDAEEQDLDVVEQGVHRGYEYQRQ